MDDGKSPLSPTRVWSPHSAALHRRRKMGENSRSKILTTLSGLSLSDDNEDDDNANDDNYYQFSSSDGAMKYDVNNSKSPGRSPGGRRSKLNLTVSLKESLTKKQEADAELQESLKNVSPEVRAKLAKVFNKKKTPMRERLQIEVDMMKNVDERKILADFKWKVERKQFNISILESIEAQQELLDRNLAEEAKRAKEEQKEMSKKRQERIEEEIAKKERELHVERTAKIHQAKNIAMGAEELRKEAEKTTEAAVRNKKKKDQKVLDREAKIQAFKDGPGRNMTHVQRELKIARMLNNGEF
jgi:hypothetical protein